MDQAIEANELILAEEVLVEFAPAPDERAAVLRRLVTSADLANAIAQDAWGATLFSNGFRLNVGQVEAVVLIDGDLRENTVAAYGVDPLG